MKKYYITITETLERTIEIVSDSEEKATLEIENQYKNGDIVLDYEDLTDTTYSTWKVEGLESDK